MADLSTEIKYTTENRCVSKVGLISYPRVYPVTRSILSLYHIKVLKLIFERIQNFIHA